MIRIEILGFHSSFRRKKRTIRRNFFYFKPSGLYVLNLLFLYKKLHLMR